MKRRRFSHKPTPPLCNELGPDDGVDPRTASRAPARKVTNRKALQLCGQIARTLNSVLGWESGDDVLRTLTIASVEPAPDSTRMLVTVYPLDPAAAVKPDEVLARLHAAAGRLRCEIAPAIHRKRVPELVFRVAGCGDRLS